MKLKHKFPEPLATRYKKYWPDFLTAYQTLYPHASEEALVAILDILQQADQERPQALKDLDVQREQKTDWFQEPHHVGVMLYVDLFSGNLAGLMTHIDYLKELGITYLHLMPLLQPRLGPNDGGYAVANYREVNAQLGTMAELRALAARLHEEGIILVIDYVMNHTAKEHTWAQAALAGDKKYQDYYLLYDDRTLPDAYEKNLPEVFPDFSPGNFTYQPEIKKWAWTTFYDFQWDLNYANHNVFAAMLQEMLFLANAGIDTLRLDAVPFLWKKMGTNSQNQPEAVLIIVALRALIRMVAPGVLFKSEAIVAPDDIIKYLGSDGFEGKACEIGYNATLMNHLWHGLASENAHLLRTTLSRLPAIPKEATWINYIRCHDDIGWGISDANAEAVGQNGRATRNFCTDFYAGVVPGSYSEGYVFQRDRQTGEARISGTAAALTGLQQAQVEADPNKINLALKRLEMMNGVIFFMRGIPLIFSGDELGQLNSFDYLLDHEKAGDNRWVHRPAMNWKKAAQRKIDGAPEQKIFDFHLRYIEKRRSSKALHGRSDDRVIMPDNDQLFVCERQFEGERMLLVANLSRQVQKTTLASLPAEWRFQLFHDVLTDTRLSFNQGALVIPPYGVYWLQASKSKAKNPSIKVVLQHEIGAEFGDTVYFLGSIGPLGNWDLSRAVMATASPYPTWRAEIELPVGESYVYKWARVRNGRIVQWSDEEFVGLAGFVG